MDNEVLDRMTMALMGASPTDDEKMASLDNQPVVQILPDANVIKIGGQSLIDPPQDDHRYRGWDTGASRL